MRTVGIIQARMGSKRLPGKSMLPLAGKPMLYRFIERVKKAQTLDKVVLATTNKKEDNCLCDIAEELDIKWFRGSENDLADRIYKCALMHGASVIVRLTADNPLIEASEIDRIVNSYLFSSNVGKLFTNTQEINNNGYPDGLGAEVYPFKLFELLWENIDNPDMREHPHKYFYKHDLVETCQCPESMRYPHIRLDVNTPTDYDFVASIYDEYGHDCHFTDYIDMLTCEAVI